MLLSKLLEGLEYQHNLNDMEIESITSDSRQVEKGCIFICIKGGRFDGHDHAEEAIKNGAALIVCERDLELPNQILVKDTHAAYGIMCGNFFGNPARKLKLIGVTGTNGKTTITYVVKHIIESFGKKVGLMGTIHNEIGTVALPAKHTTPDAYQLHSMFNRMVKAGCEYVVMEASSHAMDQDRLEGVCFEAGIFTNLTQDHLDYHGTMENYYEAKKKLFSQSKISIINLDDSYGQRLVKELKNVATYSAVSDMADFTAKSVESRADGSHFALVGRGVIGRVNFCMPGGYSVLNAMASAVCCIKLGFDFNGVVDALCTCHGVKGRTEVIKTGRDFTVIRDYAHTPDGLEKIISSTREYCGDNRIVVLFGCPGNRDRRKRAPMAEAVSKYADFAILTSDNPRDEEEMQIISDALPGLVKNDIPHKVIPDRYEAIEWALQHSQKGDVLILAGKGHEDYQVLDCGTVYFDERVIVEQLLGLR